MKNKRIVLIAIFAVIIGFGWLTTLKAVSGTEDIEAQNKLVEEADEYMERELYVRAIPLYEEALDIKTENNLSIEEKLLKAYYEYGNMQSFVHLVEARVKTNDAKIDEYITVADYYLEKGKNSDAMLLIKQGIDNLESEDLVNYYEKNRYDYKYYSSDCKVIVPTASNNLMAAYDGKNWGYVDIRGKQILPFIYDSATSFENDEYAVVSIDGVYYTILSNGDWYGANDGTYGEKLTDVKAISLGVLIGKNSETYGYYSYDFEPVASDLQYDELASNSCGVAAVMKDGKWGLIADDGNTVLDYTYEDIAINSLGCAFANDVAMAKKDGVWYIIDTKGNIVGENSFSDAKAPESDGYIAVADENGKWGFIDSEGNLVIEYQYRDAKSFSNHLAAVKVTNDWGYISEKNELVIEDLFSDAEPFHSGSAQVLATETMGMINLKYVEKQ